MVSPVLSPQDTCSVCGARLSATLRHCPTCKADAVAPNVRLCFTNANLKALADRYDIAQSRASAIGCAKEFIALEDTVKQKSGVVVSMPAGVARRLLEDSSFLYENYERLVGANARKPVDPDNDRHRYAVGGLLFGSYANYIVYGALSLTREGLPTYGDVHCRLRSITIEKRTYFLETNSYRFVKDHHIIAGDKLPVGYTACWRYRHSLVLAKLADSLSKGQTESDWQILLIHSDGKNRENDDFVEAHIFEGFDRNAIEFMVASPGAKLSREKKIDIDIAISKFNRLVGKTN